SYATAHGFAAVSLRYFNVAGAHAGFGERHTTETHLIPIVLQVALGQRDAVQIYGEDYPTPDGSCVRDSTHVTALPAAPLLPPQPAAPGAHRISTLGGATAFPAKQVTAPCRTTTGHPIPANVAERRAGDPAVLVASSDLAQQELGWRPTRTDLATIVADAWAFTTAQAQHA